MIRTTYDPEADAMFVRLGPEGVKSARTEEVAPGVVLDFDEAGNLIALEVLDLRARSPARRQAAAE
jgi:uncharacterized protein YuzE